MVRIWNRDRTEPWRGAYAPYDLVKELVVATCLIGLLAVALAVLFSSPDDPPSTIRQWARQDPVGFLSTAVGELAGTTKTAEYGPPYNHNSRGQHAAFIYLQEWLGVSHPIDTTSDYVVDPLRKVPSSALQADLTEYLQARSYLKEDGIRSYERELNHVIRGRDGAVSVRRGEYENVNNIMSSLLTLARSGGLDGDLLTSGQSFQTDDTKPLLLMADGGLLQARAERQRLLGRQWGMMNETGSYPGQVWLWLSTFWYEIEPFKNSENADILVMLVMGLLSLAFICVPFIPGVRDLPRWIPLHRVIWREHYATARPEKRFS